MENKKWIIDGNKLFALIRDDVEIRGSTFARVKKYMNEASLVHEAEWKMVIDDFDNGFGNQEYPHCSNCGRGVYRHDAGSWCPFCGAKMKNPMR